MGDLVDELFEAAVFLSPLFDLWEQIHRDVNGMGFGFELPGEVVAQVLVASGTAAVGIATGAAETTEAHWVARRTIQAPPPRHWR